EDGPDCSPPLTRTIPTSSTSVYVYWAPLDRNAKCINGVLRGYKIAYKISGRYYNLQNVDVKQPTARSFLVTRLQKFTTYSFQVLAYTIEDGPLSNARDATTLEDGPDCSPPLTRTTPTSSTSVYVYWTPLDRNAKCINGVLRRYKVAYKISGTNYKLQYVDVKQPTARWIPVTRLQKFTTYSFQVLAYTIKDGPLSNARDATTLQDEPEAAPEALHILKINTTTYTATWNEVPEHLRNGLVINYEVRWIMMRKGNQAVTGKAHTSGKIDGFSYTIHGLSLCAQYSISVRAYTRVGPGPYSAPVNITTQ
ncbi:Down syndrome cell adhesion molecule-like protein 1 homolog, partial [Actinia tenebrosa]|uniref:Down syndrome cell adhesion molecule-like protein 1 homolog n=1 Tax=Actinia tenebrosa TaxID=6105 RepID=A0A6P8HV87_ACTTE